MQNKKPNGLVVDNSPLSVQEFTSLMQEFDPVSAMAVGLSGGADSLALAFLLHQWCQSRQISLTALTFDHKIRPESSEEAEYIAEITASWSLEHVILTAQEDIGSTKIQESARNARYQAMFHYCQDRKIQTLATAHHLDDQFETVLMRFARGSGINGLSGIRAERDAQGIRLIRPVLAIAKSRLIATCQAEGLQWIEDPSNTNLNFTRAQIRQVSEHLKGIGITPENIEKSRVKIESAQSFVTEVLAQFYKDHVTSNTDEIIISGPAFEDCHPYLKTCILEKALMMIGRSQYPPKSKHLKNMLEKIARDNFKSTTLNQCLVYRTKARDLVISPENAGL